MLSQRLAAQYGEDIPSIDAIIDDYFEIISGTSNNPWQFECNKYLHSANIIIIRLIDSGKMKLQALEAEYILMRPNPRVDFYEH